MKDKVKICEKGAKDYSWKNADKVIRFKEARKGLVKEKHSKLPNHDDNVLEQLCQLYSMVLIASTKMPSN